MSKQSHLQTLCHRALTEIFRYDLKDTSIGFFTISEVRLTNDLSYLTIYYTVLGNDEKKAKVEKILKKSKGFIRSKLVQKVKMRKAPALVFKYDTTLEEAARISAGLKEVLDK